VNNGYETDLSDAAWAIIEQHCGLARVLTNLVMTILVQLERQGRHPV
jgi:hypothetical protein